jgi:uncharacterized membrane protein
MEQWLTTSAVYVGNVVQAMAIVIIAVGSIKAFIAGIGMFIFKPSAHDEMRNVYLDYARYLIAGLTFQLAADIVSTTVAPDWNEIGRLASIAVIRTFLSYFLERDLAEVRERRHEGIEVKS